MLLFICPGGGAPEDPSKLPDEPPDKSPLQSGQKSLPTDGETRSDELGPPPPDKSPAGSPDKSPVLPSKTGRPTDDKTRDDIIASYRERPNLSREERAKIFGLSPGTLYKRVRRIEAESGIQLEPRPPPVVRAKRPPPPGSSQPASAPVLTGDVARSVAERRGKVDESEQKAENYDLVIGNKVIVYSLIGMLNPDDIDYGPGTLVSGLRRGGPIL